MISINNAIYCYCCIIVIISIIAIDGLTFELSDSQDIKQYLTKVIIITWIISL